MLLTLTIWFQKMSTMQCTYSMIETVNYYNFNKSNVFVLILDASKAFDRVNYCKLFRELLKHDISPIVLRLLLYMYTGQTLRVKWGHTVSNCFIVRNGVKQRSVLSPLLFAIYTDSLLKRLEESGVGCQMGGHFTGALAYILSVYSPFSDRVGLPLHNIHIPSPFTSIMDIFFVNLKFGHIRFYTL